MDRRGLWLVGAAILALVGSRLLTAPAYFVAFDGANFALALEDYRPPAHQPQPPGYPLFVLLAKMLRPLCPGAEQALLWCGLLGAGLACAALWHLAREWGGEAAAAGSLVLLVSSPILWYAGLANPVRTFLAAGSCVVAACVWRAWNPSFENRRWLLWAGLAYGLSGGFREQIPIVLLPLWLWLLWRWRAEWRLALASSGIAALVACGWLGCAAASSGGFEWYLLMLRAYSRAQLAPSSSMPLEAAAWNLLTLAPAAWALFWFRWRNAPKGFVLLWLLPVFLFEAFVHVVDPDQALASVPVMALFGGLALAGVPRWTWTLAIAANLWLFFAAPLRHVVQPSYHLIRTNDAAAREVVEDLRAVRRQGPMQAVLYHAGLGWRVIGYYLRDTSFFWIQDDRKPFVSCVAQATVVPCVAEGPPFRYDPSMPLYVLTGWDPDLRERLQTMGARDAGPTGVVFPSQSRVRLQLGAAVFEPR